MNRHLNSKGQKCEMLREYTSLGRANEEVKMVDCFLSTYEEGALKPVKSFKKGEGKEAE